MKAKNISIAVTALAFVVGLSACATPKPPLPPKVNFNAAAGCSSVIDLASAVSLDDEPKKNRMMKNRSIVLTKILDDNALCFRNYQGADSPYAVFEIPNNLSGRVVYAGAKIYENRLVAAGISVLDSAGRVIKTFSANDFRKLGTQYGVQFNPSADAAFVMIKANNAAIGTQKGSTETVVSKAYRVGVQGFGSGGFDTVADTQTFARTFAYEGEVGIRVVFPKQAGPQP